MLKRTGFARIAVAACTCAAVASSSCARLRPGEPGVGYITCSRTPYSVNLTSRDGLISVKDAAGKQEVRTGEYKVVSCTFEAPDGQGVVWRIKGQGSPRLPSIAVAPGRTARLKLGPPLTAKVLSDKRSDSYRFDVRITGQHGEVYPVRAMTRGGKPVQPAQVEIRNNNGELITRATLKYG